MKKLTVLIRDEDAVDLDISRLVAIAVDLKIESVDSPPSRSKKPFTRHVQNGTDTRRSIMDHYTVQGTFTNEVASLWLTRIGYAGKSANSALSDLVHHGFVKKIGHYKYQFAKPLPAGMGPKELGARLDSQARISVAK